MKRILTTLCITFVSSLVAFAGIENGHEYVDLGLPSGTLWATCNIGADTPENHGYYFAWGEIEPKRSCEACYKWVVEFSPWFHKINKYTIPDGNQDGIWYDQGNFIGDNKHTLEPEDDAAHVNWGGAWRMPTYSELQELIDACNWIDTTQNDVRGCLVIGPNENSIFLPMAGTMSGEYVNEFGSCMFYWSSSISGECSSAMKLSACGAVPGISPFDRPSGNSIRAIINSQCLIASGSCGAEGSNLTWQLSCDSVLTISGDGQMANYDWSNPVPWYEYIDKISTLVITESVTDAVCYGFTEATNLKTIYWNTNKVSRMCDYNYWPYCKRIIFGENVRSIPDFMCYHCDSLIEVTFPSSLDSIKYAFANCNNLKKITIPEEVTYICGFYGCSSIEELSIPASVKTIETIFDGCSSLKRIVIQGDSMPVLGCGWTDCYLYAQDSIEVSVPCDFHQQLKQRWIGYWDMVNWKYEERGASYFTIRDTVCTSDLPYIAYPKVYGGCYEASYWESGEYIIETTSSVITGCDSIVMLNLTVIDCTSEPECPAYCVCGKCGDDVNWSLDTISGQLNILGSGAMSADFSSGRPWENYGSYIRSINIEEGVTSIADWAFYATDANMITIPSSVVFIADSAFEYSSFDSILIAQNNRIYDSRNSCNAIIQTTENRLIVGCKNTIIPSGVVRLEKRAFYGVELRSIDIPKSVTSIGSDVFASSPFISITCYSINPPSCDYGAFTGVNRRTSVNVPCEAVDAYRSAGEWRNFISIQPILGSCQCLSDSGSCGADGNGSNLIWKLNCEGTLAIEGSGAMKNYAGSESPWNKLLDTFSQITSVIIGEGVTTIGTFAFYYCSNITSISIPNSVTSIGYQAFSGCKGLTSIIIPDSVTSIGGNAFSYCLGLTSITCKAMVPPSCDAYCFDYLNKSISLYVPCESVEAYQSAEGWKDFSNIQPIPETCTSEPECPEFCVCGQCGDSAYWRVDSIAGLLEITGTGAMYDYGSTNPLPWKNYGDYIRTARVNEGITHLSGDFMGKSNGNVGLTNSSLDSVFLPSTLQTMGTPYPFYCASNLKYIQCDAVTPPTGYVMKGENSNAELRVPCGSKKAYSQASGWKNYKNIVDGSYYFELDTVICGSSRDFEWLGYPILYYPREYTYHYADTIREEWRTYEMDSTVTIINTSVNGCDSIHTLNVHYASYFYYTETIEINSGESYRGYTQSGTYYERTQNRFGCDSIVYEIRLTVVPSVPSTHTITVNTSNTRYGSVSGGGTYNYGDTIMITAEPKQGYNFTGWDDGSTDNPRYVIVTGDSTFTAQFAVRYCEFVVEPNDFTMGAIVNIDSYQETYRFGTQLTVEASPNSGYKFVKWNTGKNFNPYTITLTDDLYLLAIFAEEDEIVDTTTVKPGNNNATFEWPFIEGGFSYSLTIYLDIACTMPFVTIKFDASGRFVGLAFPQKAPRRAKTSEQSDGFTYTIEGLDTNTEYFYKMQTYDANNLLINTDEGSFVTKDVASSIEETTVNKYVNTPIKLLRDGQLLILRDGKTYNMQGAVVNL